MKKIIDLHTHTTASDGLYSPADLVKKAKEVGLSALGIADHDSINGIKEALSMGEKMDLEVIPSVEITAYWKARDRKEFHILSYYIDIKSREVIDTFSYYQRVREERGQKIVAKLQELGFSVSYEKVKELAGGTVGRPHLARAVLGEKKNEKKLKAIFGQIPDMSTFIQAYLITGKPAYIEKAGMEPPETINFIHRNKGVAVLAHPGWDLKIGEEDVIKQFADWGVDGIEAIHGKETKKDTLNCIQYFTGLAKKYHLLITGGSDFHADRESEPGADLGLLNWGIEIPYKLLESLKKRGVKLAHL